LQSSYHPKRVNLSSHLAFNFPDIRFYQKYLLVVIGRVTLVPLYPTMYLLLMAASGILDIYKYLNTKYQKLIMSIESISPTLFSIGSGGLIGFLVGFAIKRIFKILAVLVGLFLGALIYFQSQGLISINWEKLQAMTQSTASMLVHSLTDTSQISVISGNLGIPLTGGLAAGFAFGIMKG
jgi:uncharacterized membrane protein (Fun14 family)